MNLCSLEKNKVRKHTFWRRLGFCKGGVILLRRVTRIQNVTNVFKAFLIKKLNTFLKKSPSLKNGKTPFRRVLHIHMSRMERFTYGFLSLLQKKKMLVFIKAKSTSKTRILFCKYEKSFTGREKSKSNLVVILFLRRM